MKRAGVTAKIWMSIAVIGLGYVVSIAFNQVQSVLFERRLELTAAGLFPAAWKAQAAETGFQRMTKHYRDAVMTEDAAALDQARQEGGQVVAGIRALAAIRGLAPQRASAAAGLADRLAQLTPLLDQTYSGAVQAKGNVGDALTAGLREAAAKTDESKAALDSLVRQTSDDLRAELAGAVSGSVAQRRLGLGFCLFILLVSGFVVHFTIQRAIRKPLDGLAGRLSASSDQIALASRQLSGASDLLARNASQQAASIEEISAASEEANAMARSNAHHAGEARGWMQQSGQNYEAVNSAHAKLVEAMGEIGQSSSKISKIIRVIDEIAFQTNILALNAAVEAARAGEAGMGFAVVADEVRNLAQRSAQAARDTASLIEDSVSHASAGQTRLEAVTKLLATNSEIAGKVGCLVDEISRASEEQARGIEQISRTVQLTSQGTQQTAASAEESASSVESMSAQVRELNAVVGSLHAMIGG